MFASFWGGFGWLETVPGNVFLTVSVAAIGSSAVVLLLWLAVRRDVRRFVWLSVFGLGFLLTLAADAFATYEVPRNLHGRYLIGPYLVILSVMLAPIALVPQPSTWKHVRDLRPTFVLMVAGVIHAYCLSLILRTRAVRRYF